MLSVNLLAALAIWFPGTVVIRNHLNKHTDPQIGRIVDEEQIDRESRLVEAKTIFIKLVTHN